MPPLKGVASIWLSLILSHAAASLAQLQGNGTARLEACTARSPPASYLDVQFLGEREFVATSSVNFSYLRFGPLSPTSAPGAPLLLIAGQGATSSVWTPDLLRGLAQNREVIPFDNMGIGLSTTLTDTNYSAEAYAVATVDLIGALGLEQPAVLGWSLGGAIAMRAEAQYPGTFSRIILTGSGVGGSHQAPTTPAFQPVIDEILEYVDEGIPVPAWLIFPDTDAGNDGLCRFTQSLELMPEDDPQQEATLQQKQLVAELALPSYNYVYERLRNFSLPVLAVWGSQDWTDELANAFVLIQDIPGASLLQFPDAGHGVLLQHDHAVAALISAWLDADLGGDEQRTSGT